MSERVAAFVIVLGEAAAELLVDLAGVLWLPLLLIALTIFAFGPKRWRELH